MSEFVLVIEKNVFQIFKVRERPLEDKFIVIGRRDPEQEIVWKPGAFYYNPFYNGRLVYIYREDQKLVSTEGQPVPLISLRNPYNRTWFEIIPQPLRSEPLAPNLTSMIEAIPKQVKPVSQAIMQELGIRVPPDFNPTDAQSWYQWLMTVNLPMGAQFKEALRRAASAKVVVSVDIEKEFLEGKITPSGVEIQIRMFQVQEVTKKVRQIHDTNYITVRVPQNILDQGMEAVRSWISQNTTLANKFQLAQEPISERLLESKITRTSPIELIGYQRLSDKSWINLWAESWNTNDLIREILEEESNNSNL